MKKYITIGLIFVFIFSLFIGCSDKTNNTISNDNKLNYKKIFTENLAIPTTPETAKAIKFYKDVMKNKVKLIQKSYKGSYDEGKTYQPFYLNELLKNLEMEESWKPNLYKFTIIDLDGDKIPEVVIEINPESNGFYEVLHYYNGTVYGYYFVYRAMESLKTDGTYIGSSGASDNYILKTTFSGSSLNEITFAYSEMTSHTDKNGYAIVKYYITSKSTTEQKFNSVFDKQMVKKDAPWCELNVKNIEKYFEGG